MGKFSLDGQMDQDGISRWNGCAALTADAHCTRRSWSDETQCRLSVDVIIVPEDLLSDPPLHHIHGVMPY